MRPPWSWWRTPLALPEAPLHTGRADPPCLVHLVREVNGLEAFRAFVAALRAHSPGVEHELVLAMKGFASRAQAAPYLEEVADLAPKTLFFVDRGMDLGVYLALAARLRRDRYCFVNSHGRPLVDGWLALLDAALARPGVGQVGATGSWASMHSWVTYSMGLPSAYRALLPSRGETREQLLPIQLEWEGVDRRSPAGSARARCRTLVRLPEELCDFEPFPTHHVRPNTFMIAHATLRMLSLFVVRNKMDTYVLESSRESLTWQLARAGLSSLVVDRAGAVYEPGEWHRSRTFWQGDQEGLLVADNQTLCYTVGRPARRRVLSTLAWGLQADPGYDQRLRDGLQADPGYDQRSRDGVSDGDRESARVHSHIEVARGPAARGGR